MELSNSARTSLSPKEYQHLPVVLENDIIAQNTSKPLPMPENEFDTAYGILQTGSGDTGDTLYDHLSCIIKHVLDEKVSNVADYFEEYSRKLREQRFCIRESYLDEIYERPRGLKASNEILSSIKKFFMLREKRQPEIPRESQTIDIRNSLYIESKHEEIDLHYHPPPNNIFHLQFYWRLAGYGFPERENFYLSFAMMRLRNNPDIKSFNFWGKIFTLKESYYIVEATLTDVCTKTRNLNIISSHPQFRKSEINDNIMNLFPRDRATTTTDMDDIKPRPNVASLPINDFIPKLKIPAEKYGEGVNRYTYFVLTNFKNDWTELPLAIPEQINVSKQIQKFFTGDLQAPVNSYPPFPGIEENYLRSIIARISASTHISPRGYFNKVDDKKLNEVEEAEDEGSEEQSKDDEVVDAEIIFNSKYKPFKAQELLDINNWVHHKGFILKQGRVWWIKPPKITDPRKYFQFQNGLKANGEYDMEEEIEGFPEEAAEEGEEEENEENKEMPEKGLYLFSSCFGDASDENTTAWTIRISSMFIEENTTVLARSNIWPGAVAFITESILNNIYIGWGNKYRKRNYSPPQLPLLFEEYPIGPEILEINDPTFEDEEAWRIAHEVKSQNNSENENEEEGNEEV